MAKVNIQEINPERYAQVKAAQNSLRNKCSGMMKMVRLCPYCDHRVENVARGEHGYTFAKCSNCGEEVVFPPVSFRKTS
jgi:hydrogenase maturation factor HypF (carbamoyltransferase family)